MTTLEKLKLFKNNTKERLRKIKEIIIKKLKTFKNYINVFTIQFVLIIVTIALLINSLIMTKHLYKQLDNVSKQLDATISSLNSQNQVENEDKAESSDSSTTSSSIDPTDTSSTDDDILTPIHPVNSTPTIDSTNIITGTTTDLDLLACVIYQEAGGNGSCDTCRRRVADVVLNRVADPRFPNTIREVLTARNQYGRFYYTGIVWPSRSKKAVEQNAVARAYRIAAEVLNGQHSELYGNGYIWQAAFRQGYNQIYCCGHYYGM